MCIKKIIKIDIRKIANEFSQGKTREKSDLVYQNFNNVRIDTALVSV